MPTLEETLKRLAVAFTARDIMIPDDDLVCAESESDAPRVSGQYPDYNVIPIRNAGKLVGYFERDNHEASVITLETSDGTGLLDLIEIIEDRQFSFVLSHRQIAGYVHFSDLNHSLVKRKRRIISDPQNSIAKIGQPAALAFV